MNRKIRKIRSRLLMTAVCLILGLGLNLTTVFAATANIIFDNSPYSATYQDSSDEDANTLSFDVSINCDEKPGTYYVELVYDTTRLQYTGGADREDNGVLVLEGTATASRIVYTLDFDVISGGNAGIYVQYADIVSSDGSSRMDIGTMDYGTITIEGTDNSGAADFGHNVKDINTKIPFLGKVSINGTEYYVTDQSQYIPDTPAWTYETIEDQITLSDGTTQNITYLTGEDQRMRFLYLMDSVGEFHLFAVGTDGTFYPCVETEDYFYVSAQAAKTLPDGMTVDDIKENNIVYLQYKNCTGEFVFKNSDGEYEVWSAESMNAADQGETATASSVANSNAKDDSDAKKDSDKKSFLSNISPRFIIVIVAVIIVIVLIILIVVKSRSKQEESRRSHHRNHDERRKARENAIQRNRNRISNAEESDDDGLNVDDAEDLFFGLDSAEKTVKETVQPAVQEDEETVEDESGETGAEYAPERLEAPVQSVANVSGMTSDISEMDQKLSEIPDEPGVTPAEPLSFTAEIQMNLEAMDDDDFDDDLVRPDEVIEDIDAAVDAFPDIEDEKTDDTIDFRKALEKALEDGKFDL